MNMIAIGCTMMTINIENDLEAVNELSNKFDKLTTYITCSSMGVKERHSDNVDISSRALPLKTPEEMRTLEVALKKRRFHDPFVSCD